MITALLLAALTHAASPDAPRRLSRAEALELARRQNPDLIEARLGLARAEAETRAAGELPNPTLGLSYGADDPKLVGTLDQKLPIFGQRGAAIRAAEAEAHTVQAEIALQELRSSLVAERAYTAALVAREQLRLAREAEGLARELAERLRSKVENRLASDLEQEQAQLEAERAHQDVLDRETAAAQADLALALTLGLEPTARLEPSDPLVPIPAPGAPAVAHPELNVADLEIEAARARGERERAAVRPTPDVSLEVEQRPTDTVAIGLRAGVGFELPVLSQNRGAVAREAALEAQAEAHHAALSKRLTGQLTLAKEKFQAAQARSLFFEERFVPAAQRVSELTRGGYELGRVPLITFLQARAELNRARASAIDAAGQAWDARADLEEAQGVAH